MQQAPSLRRSILKYFWQYLFGLGCLLAVDYLELFIPQLTGEITDGLTAGNFAGSILLRDVLLIVGIAAAVLVLSRRRKG